MKVVLKMKNKDLFKIGESIADSYVKKYEYPFEVLPHIKDIILEIGSKLDSDFYLLKENVWVHESAKISASSDITGPCIIDSNAEIRPNAYIRGNAIIGKNCVFGNSCEIKNSILYDNVQVPHFNYVGDSILGNFSHMGAGSITSNVKSDKTLVVIKNKDEKVETKLKKVGAFLGDFVEVGCNSVLNPGTVVMPNTNIYPLTMIRGVIDGDMIVKSMDNIIKKENV